MENKNTLLHQRLKVIGKQHVFVIPNVVMDDMELKMKKKYTIIIREESE